MELYFEEPRLKLSTFSDFLAKVLSSIFYFVLVISTPILIFSDIQRLKILGWLFVLFLIDRLRHFKEAEKSLWELKKIKAFTKKENLNFYLTPSAREVLVYSYRRVLALNHNFYLTLLKSLINLRDIQVILKRLEIKKEEFEQKIDEYLNQFPEKQEKKILLEKIEDLVKKSYQEALILEEIFIEPRNLLSALVNIQDPVLGKLLELFNVTPSDFKNASIFSRYLSRFFNKIPSTLGGFWHHPYKIRHRVMNRAWTARPTPVLDQFSLDLTDLARSAKVGFLIGHQEEFNHLLDVLARPDKPNAILIGEPSVGKSTIVYHLAFCLVKDLVPPALFDKRLVSLDIGKLMANANAEILVDRVKKIMDEVFFAGNIILHFPNLSDFLKTTEVGALSPIDILMPLFRSNSIPIIIETSPREYKEILEKKSEFESLFELVRVEEISEEEAIRFLVFDALILEPKFKIFISFKAIKKAVFLAKRYFRNKLLPSSADELLKHALSEAQRQKLKFLSEDLVVEVAEEKSKIPLKKTSTQELEILLNLEKIIHQRLVNQEQAVKAVSEALRQYRSGLARKGGPIASFLFVGPTGVGKTEISKILAKILFGSEELMIRFDMSEYQDKKSIHRFLGSSQSGVLSSLTEAVLQKPYSLILLDEFEKAHPDILNLFLQVFDDGRLTDDLGRTVDFQNTIIIATSNALSDFIKEELEKNRSIEEISFELKKKLTSVFRPELLNRFSEIIVFRNLNLEEIFQIAKIQLNDLAQTLKEVHGITLTFEESAVRKLAELGYSPIFGARPLRQVIASKVKSLLSEKILKKEIDRGNEIMLKLEGDNFEIKIIS